MIKYFHSQVKQPNIHLSIFLFASIFLFQTGLAQSDFKPGYVILNSGDSVYGEIDYQSDILMANKSRFRNNADEEFTEYTPSELRGYHLQEGHNVVL